MGNFNIQPKGFISRVLWPFSGILLSRLLASLAAMASGYNPFALESWIRWDSHQYLEIAQKGYLFVSCRSIGYPSDSDACGNCGWFPAYPFLIRIFSWFLPSFESAAVAIPCICFFIFLYILWNGFLRRQWNLKNTSILMLAVVFPGAIYYQAAFPVSLYVLCLLLLIQYLRKERYLHASLAGFALGLSYPSGLSVALGLALYGVLLRMKEKVQSKKIVSLAGVAICVLSGTAATMAIQWFQTGVRNAFLLTHEKYGHFRNWPFHELWQSLLSTKGMLSGSDFSAPAFQTVLVAVFMMVICISAFKAWAKLTREEILVLSLSIGGWAFPHLFGGGMSFYRSESLLLPVVLLFPMLPRRFAWAAIIVFAGLAWTIDILFFKSILV